MSLFKAATNAATRVAAAFEPVHYMFFGVAFVVFFALAWQFSGGRQRAKVKLSFVDNDSTKETAGLNPAARSQSVMLQTDPAARLALRITDADSLATGLLLFLLNKKFVVKEELPANAGSLVTAFAESDLLPPLAKVLLPAGTDYAAFSTSSGAYFLRYRPSPTAMSREDLLRAAKR